MPFAEAGIRWSMPSKPLTPCSFPGCGTLVKRGRCAEHTVKQSERRRHDPEQRRFYSSTAWRKLSLWVRQRDPICTVCQRAPSAQAHHKDGDWRNSDPSNLAGICKSCHQQESGSQHGRRGQ